MLMSLFFSFVASSFHTVGADEQKLLNL